MTDLILVLGHFDDTVHLTPTGRERLDLGIALHRARPGSRISVTGCAANHPRTLDVRVYLSSHGVAAEALAPLIDSHNTAEDAFLTEPLICECKVGRIVLVTSDYHLARAQTIFEQVFPTLPIEPHGAPHHAPEQELQALRQHEAEALRAIEREGLYRPNHI